MTISVFIDPVPEMAAQHADLFEQFGVEAYSMLFWMEQMEQAEEEEAIWNRFKTLRDGSDEDDEEIDLGPEEPDDYGE